MILWRDSYQRAPFKTLGGVRYRSPCLAFIFLLSLEGMQVTPWKLWTVHQPLLCAYPSLGCFPVVGALELGQLKLLYVPHLSTRPLEDSESTTKNNLAEWIQSVHQLNRLRVLYFFYFFFTYQNSFRHVLPKNKFCFAGCTVCGIFWTERAAAK